jgi:inosine/xanthosine triphosphate pyrophosphatase family protein
VELIFVDGNDYRAAELREIIPGLTFRVEPLQAGFSTSAPEPEHKARDKVLAHPAALGCFAEAADLTTMEGKSLRLELDSENEVRFCKWWRERPAKIELRIALRRAPDAALEVFAATCPGVIANKPAGPHLLGWDRLFLPHGEHKTLAELSAAGECAELRYDIYGQLARALGLPYMQLES